MKFTHPCRNKLWYPFTEEEDATFSLKRKLDEPLWFIPLLGIIDQHGRTNRLTSLYPEQVRIIQAFKNKKADLRFEAPPNRLHNGYGGLFLLAPLHIPRPACAPNAHPRVRCSWAGK